MGEPRAPHSGKLQRCGLQAFRVVIGRTCPAGRWETEGQFEGSEVSRQEDAKWRQGRCQAVGRRGGEGGEVPDTREEGRCEAEGRRADTRQRGRRGRRGCQSEGWESARQ